MRVCLLMFESEAFEDLYSRCIASELLRVHVPKGEFVVSGGLCLECLFSELLGLMFESEVFRNLCSG